METIVYALFAVDILPDDCSESESSKLIGVFSSVEIAQEAIKKEGHRRTATRSEWQPDYWAIVEYSLDSTVRKLVVRL